MNTDLLDLGVVEQPLLIFGGPCSNLQATEALLAIAEHEGFTADRIICTGDLVAYCADPAATVDRIRDSGIHVVLGNCEQSLGSDADDCGCGFNESSSCDLLSQKWYRFAQQHVDADARRWLGSRPGNIRFSMNDRTLMVVHGSYSEINQFVFPATDTGLKESELDAADADAIIGGHCGVPFSQKVGHRLWHNAGIIGVPANDGTSKVWFSTVEPVKNNPGQQDEHQRPSPGKHGGDLQQENCIRISHRSLEYDFHTASRRMFESDLAHAYADTLVTGIWPADDIMPAPDRQRRGVAIRESQLYW